MVSASAPTEAAASTPSGLSELGGAVAPVRKAQEQRALWIVRAGFAAYAAALPLHAMTAFGDRLAVAKLAGIALLLIALVQPRLTLRRPHAAVWWLVAYLMVATIASIPVAQLLPGTVLLRLATVVQLLLTAWVTTNIVRDADAAALGLRAFAVSCIVVDVLMILGMGRTQMETARGTRFSFAGGNPNSVGTTLSLGLLASVGLAYASQLTSRLWKRGTPLMALLTVPVVMYTGSRGAVLAVIGGLLVIGLQTTSFTKRFRNVLVIAFLGSLVYYGVSNVSVSRARWEDAMYRRDTSRRAAIYRSAIEMAIEKPILGWGFEANMREMAQRVPQAAQNVGDVELLDTHNLLLHVLTESGLLGLVPFLVGLWLCIVAAFRARNSVHGLIPLILVVAVLFATTTSNWMWRSPLWFILGYALGAGMAVPIRRPRAQSLPDRKRLPQSSRSAISPEQAAARHEAA